MFNKNISVIFHVIGWLLFISMILAFVTSGRDKEVFIIDKILSPEFILLACIYPAIFYLNQFLLVPKFFISKKYGLYALMVVALLLVIFYVKPFEQLLHSGEASNIGPPPQLEGIQTPPPPGPPDTNAPRNQTRFDIISTVLFFVVWAVSTLIVLIQRWRVTEINKAEVEIQKANAELAFLKAQVSPHFLFNTLNNIYSLALAKSDKAASSILRLSNMMRYVTDDARETFVAVEKELSCINDYIELQKLRHGNNINLTYQLTGEYGDTKIAPLILIAFIENVFKHGVSRRKDANILIKIDVNETCITLFTQNDIFHNRSNMERSGVGLENAIKRLAHLYPSRHILDIDSDDEKFTVTLRLFH